MLRVLISALALALSLPALAQDVITLRPVARLAIGAPVTLGDVAVLSGGAEALADVVILENPMDQAGADRRLDVSLDDVREKLELAPGFAAGRMNLRGEHCRVILRTPVVADESPASDLRPAPKSGIVGLTVQDHVEAKLLQTFGVPKDQLQLTYDDSDARLLAFATSGWTVDVQPVGSSATMPMRITMYDASGNIRDESVRVGVRILREVVRTTRALGRGAQLSREDYEIDTAWLAPDVPYIEPMAVGTVRLRRSTGAGEMLTTGHAEQAEVIKRGEIVSVHVVSGTFVLRSPARALEAGRIGDTIEFEPLEGGGRFSAEVKAAGRAVAIAGATHLSGAKP